MVVQITFIYLKRSILNDVKSMSNPIDADLISLVILDKKMKNNWTNFIDLDWISRFIKSYLFGSYVSSKILSMKSYKYLLAEKTIKLQYL